MLRTIKFWVRALPRQGVGKPGRVYHTIYRTKKQAMDNRIKGDIVIQMTGHYVLPPGKREVQP